MFHLLCLILIMSSLLGFNPFESEITCLHPQIILNPHFADLVAQFGNYVLKGEFFHIDTRYDFTPFKVHNFNPGFYNANKHNVTLNDIGDCYIVDMSTGDVFPMYFIVPCGKCLVCNDLKISSFVRRCQYESQMYNCPPIHVTLTYDEAHLPDDLSVNLRHIQLWKKRVCTMLEQLYFGRGLRFSTSAEYGHINKKRPHYHVLIWNCKPNEIFTYQLLHDLMYKCWYEEGDIAWVSMCRKSFFTFSPVTLDYIPKGCTRSLRDMGKTMVQAFGYVAKYFYKQDDSDVPPGRKPTFHTFSKSSRLGGIGAPFIDSHAEVMRSRFYKSYQYIDRFSGKVFNMPYDRYLLDRVFPSKYKIVPYKIRECVKFLQRHDGLVPSLSPWVSKVFDVYSQIFPCLVVPHKSHYCYRGRTCCPLVTDKLIHDRYVSSLWKCYDFITGLDPGIVISRDQQRHHFLSLLFREKRIINVNDLKIKLLRYRYRRKFEFSVL